MAAALSERSLVALSPSLPPVPSSPTTTTTAFSSLSLLSSFPCERPQTRAAAGHAPPLGHAVAVGAPRVTPAPVALLRQERKAPLRTYSPDPLSPSTFPPAVPPSPKLMLRGEEVVDGKVDSRVWKWWREGGVREGRRRVTFEVLYR